MAYYTVTLGKLITDGYDVEAKALTNYKCSDPEFKKELNAAIIKHFWNDEIGQPTADEFSYYLDRAMCEIMPYYDARRKINLLDVGADPLQSYSALEKTIFKGIQNSTGSDTMTRTSTGTDKRTDDFADTNSETRNGTATRTNTRTDNLNDTATASEQQNTTDSNTNNTTDSTNSFERVYAVPTSGIDESTAGLAGSGFNTKYATGGREQHNEETSESTDTKTGSVTVSRDNTETHTGTVKDEGNDITKDTAESSHTNKGTSALERKNEDSEQGSHSNETNTNNNNSVERSGTNEAKFELLAKYREVIENITMMIINDNRIQKCFMGVYEPLGGEW